MSKQGVRIREGAEISPGWRVQQGDSDLRRCRDLAWFGNAKQGYSDPRGCRELAWFGSTKVVRNAEHEKLQYGKEDSD